MNPETIRQTEILTFFPDLNGEASAECEIILPDYCPNVLRILQTEASATVHTVLPTAEKLTAEGSVTYKILYLAEDGSGMKALSQQTPFTCQIETKNGIGNDCSVTAVPRNCTARALTPKKIFVRSTVQISVKIEKNTSVPNLPDGNSYEIKKQSRRAVKLISSAEKPLRISDEFSCEYEKNVTEILQERITFRETEQKPLTDKLITKADMIFDLLCADEGNRLFSLRKSVPVSQILDLPGMEPDAFCRTEYRLISLNLTLRDESADGKQTIAYDAEISVVCHAYSEVSAEWSEDAYSVKKTTECITESFSSYGFLPIDETGSVRETADIGTCSSLLWCDVRSEWKNTHYSKETDTIRCEGIWNCRILMTDTDGTPCAALREIPFALEVSAKGCTTPVYNDTDLILTDPIWTLNGTGTIEIRGNYRWQGMIFGKTEEKAVVQINEKTERTVCEDTVTLYYAKEGESVWDIAKEHACPYGEFVRTNRLECEILTEDKMLILIAE